jgi:hypothetical protein
MRVVSAGGSGAVVGGGAVVVGAGAVVVVVATGAGRVVDEVAGVAARSVLLQLATAQSARTVAPAMRPHRWRWGLMRTTTELANAKNSNELTS